MTHEDALREVLHDVDEPVGAGSFDDVRARARRLDRRARLLKAGAAVIVVLAAVGISIPLLGDDDKDQPVITEPGPDRSTTTTVPYYYNEPGAIWPFTSGSEADDLSIEVSGDATDALHVARLFLETFAGMTPDALEIREGTRTEANIVATAGNRTTTLAMRRLGVRSQRWTVVSARADGLQLDAPGPNGEVTSPLRVEGRATAFEGTVLVKVFDRAKEPNELGRGVVTGEMGELKPFSGEVSFQAGEMVVGAVIASTESAEDGSVEQVAAVPIRLAGAVAPATPALAADEIVAVLTTDVADDPDMQDVVVLGTERGDVRRVLIDDFDTSEGGILDVAVSDDRRTVLVAVATSACTSEVRSIAADASEVAIVGSGERIALSPNGRWLAAAVHDACEDHEFVEIRDLRGDAPAMRFDAAYGQGRAQIGQLAWVDDDRIVFDVHGEDGVSLRLLQPDVEHRVLRGATEGVSWSQPERDAKGDVRVFVSSGSIEYLDPSDWTLTGVGFETDSDVTSHTVLGKVAYWLTPDGVLRASDDRVVRRDVALIAS